MILKNSLLISAALLPMAGAGALAAGAAPTSITWTQEDPLKDIRSKDPAVREGAARALAELDSDRAVGALTKAAKDDGDVLVQLAAVDSLGKRGPGVGGSAEKVLSGLALGSKFVRVRRAAAEAFAKVNGEAARAKFLKGSTGKTLVASGEALTWAIGATAPNADEEEPRTAKDIKKECKKLTKTLKSKSSAERVVAARALVAMARGNAEARASVLGELVVERAARPGDADIVSAALETVAQAPDAADQVALAPVFAERSLPTVVERRLEHAFAVTIAGLAEDAQAEAILGLAKDAGAPRAARVASRAEITDAVRLPVLEELLGADDVSTRAAAAKALARSEAKGAAIAIERMADEDEARVQLQYVETIAAHGDPVAEEEGKAGAAAEALILALSKGANGIVQARAAVALGRPDVHRSVVSALSTAAQKGGDELKVVAAIALGRTRSGGAVAALTTLSSDDEWQIRAAAAEGFKQLSAPECVAPLLAMLEDKHSSVVATAHRALLAFSGREGQEVDPKEWPEWWEANAKKARFRTKEEKRENAARYGYAVDDSEIYKGLDVVVIPGRGDHIESVLERLGIEFRIAQAGQISEAGLHPAAILLVGCTGEIAPDDVEVVRWYVQSGGALFTSCWALSYTVQPTFPAVLSKFPSPGEVMDNVYARPTSDALSSAYLRGVFEGDVQPFYSLVGAHLIEILDPERAEVLLDSPSAAARHGTGDLAAWFRAGHGVVLDTANHFEEQGFSAAKNLDKPVDRQAFAVNHMGLSLARLREVAKEKWWKSTSQAAKEISDLSVFRILTNFVREKRING